jgi:hypothetical protein
MGGVDYKKKFFTCENHRNACKNKLAAANVEMNKLEMRLIKKENNVGRILSRVADRWPRDREVLKPLEKSVVSVNALYVKSNGDFHLFMYVRRHQRNVTMHMWVRKPVIEGVEFGDIVSIEGVVLSYTKKLKDGTTIKNYGLHNARVTKFKYDR